MTAWRCASVASWSGAMTSPVGRAECTSTCSPGYQATRLWLRTPIAALASSLLAAEYLAIRLARLSSPPCTRSSQPQTRRGGRRPSATGRSARLALDEPAVARIGADAGEVGVAFDLRPVVVSLLDRPLQRTGRPLSTGCGGTAGAGARTPPVRKAAVRSAAPRSTGGVCRAGRRVYHSSCSAPCRTGIHPYTAAS